VARKIKARISLLTGFRPLGLCTREMSRQYRRNPARCHPTTVLGVTRISGFFQPAQSLRNTIQNNLCRALSRRRGRLVRKVKSCWRRARFSRMRSSRERKALITQPMRCRSHEIMAKIVSKHPSTNRWQLVHSPSAPGFDEGQALIEVDITNKHQRSGLMRRLVALDREMSTQKADISAVGEPSGVSFLSRGGISMRPIKVKPCRMCSNAAQFSLACHLSIIGVAQRPRSQKCSRVVLLCESCIRELCDCPPRDELRDALRDAYTRINRTSLDVLTAK
jgi:hypothetical protein